MKLTRTEKWKLVTSSNDRKIIEDTITQYRRFVRALTSVCITHWPSLNKTVLTKEGKKRPPNSQEVMTSIERLIHPTKQRPNVKYKYFSRVFYKFPSYLRRSAINDAIGYASSFLTRYDQWQSNTRRKNKKSRPPRLGVSGSYPSLYKGQCIKYADDLKSADIKVFKDGDWKWITIKIRNTGKRAHDVIQKRISPQLICKNGRACLAVPHEQTVKLGKVKADVVCSVDVGINTNITASIVRSDGTVLARTFIHKASDTDHIHKRLNKIRKAASKTKKLSKGFAKKWYRKAYNIAKENSHYLSRTLVEFAKKNGATTIVFERLKGWRPKAPRYGLKQRFHTWLHRRVVEFTEWKWREYGGRMASVPAYNTSKFAYDGSGKVKRGIKEKNSEKSNYSICKFQNGKIYNCDLNATYNIAAKYFLRGRDTDQLALGQSPRAKSRMPITLSLLWSTPVSV